jgi:hypothetical protein
LVHDGVAALAAKLAHDRFGIGKGYDKHGSRGATMFG